MVVVVAGGTKFADVLKGHMVVVVAHAMWDVVDL